MNATNMVRIFAAIFAVAMVYELIAAFNSLKGDTISEIVWKISTNHPLIPFLLGMVCGHWFWNRGTN
jgi:predicted permease